MSELKTTIETPQTVAEKTGEYRTPHFDYRFMDVCMDTVQVALVDYLTKRGEIEAAEAVDCLWELAGYTISHALFPDNDASFDLVTEPLARMSVLVPKLGGRFHGPSGYTI